MITYISCRRNMLFVVALSRVYVTSGKFIPKHLIDHFNIISARIDALVCVKLIEARSICRRLRL